MLDGRERGATAEDQQFDQRIRTQPVGAVQADAGALAGGEQAGQRRGSCRIGGNPAHHVVHHGADRHRLLDDIDAEVGLGQFAHQRQAFVDLLFAEVAHVKQHAFAPLRSDGIALLQFVPVGLADAVARTQFHGLQLRLAHRSFGAHAVVGQVAAAVLIHQDPAFTAAGFGQQAAGVGQSGRVVLDELHVLKRRAGAVGHGHAVAGLDCAVGGERKHAPSAAAGDDHRLGVELAQLAAAHFHGGHALATAVIDQQVERVVLVVARDGRELQRSLEQGVQYMEAGLVGSEPGALLLHAAEGPHRHRAVCFTVPGAAPVLQLQQFLGRLVDEVFDAILVGEPVATAHGIVEVHVEAVIRLDHAGGSAFRGAGMAAHRVDLGDQRNAKFGGGLGEGDGGSQTGTPCAYDCNIGRDGFHALIRGVIVGLGPPLSAL